MKIALFALNSSYVHTNLAVRCIADALEKHGFSPCVIERSMKDRSREILSALASAEADVYGFSVYIWNRDAMLALAADLRELLPDAKIVLGGPEISFEDESFFARYPFVDNIIAGEGEDAFVSFCTAFPPRHSVVMGTPYADFAKTGILYDSYPPDSHSGGILYYESARGCPYKCSYCLSSAVSGVRVKSADDTIDQLRAFEKIDGVRVIKFVDRTFNFDRCRADKIWRAIAGDSLTKTYHFEICADLLDEENFATLAAMPKGKIQLECGVQSTNPETLAAIGRTSDPQKIIAALKRIRSVGNIHIHADLIAGLPREDFARFAQSFDAVYGACDLLQLGFLKLLPGTALRKSCRDLGYRYSQNPPYEVLSSDSLSYGELCRLHAVDDVLDRFAGSGHFANTLLFLLRDYPSPFAFFDGLAQSMQSPRALSQREAVSAFRAYAQTVTADAEKLDACLALDWYLWERGSLPHGLPDCRHPLENDVRRAYCETHAEVHPSEVIVCRLPIYADAAVLIDRVRHTFEVIPEGK